jgi:hypothetical protein
MLSLCLTKHHPLVLGEWRYSSTHSWPRTTWKWVVSFTPRQLFVYSLKFCIFYISVSIIRMNYKGIPKTMTVVQYTWVLMWKGTNMSRDSLSNNNGGILRTNPRSILEY